jgi:Putative peptidoglycan binding domain
MTVAHRVTIQSPNPTRSPHPARAVDRPVLPSHATATNPIAPISSLSHRTGQPLHTADLMRLQRSHGNLHVQRLLSGRMSESAKPSASATAVIYRTVGDGHDLTSPLFAGDETLEACFDNETRLGEGARGPSVSKVQQALLERGFDLGPAGADGVYGRATAAAIRKFKTDEGLGFEQFGDVGPGTMRRLDELFASAEPETAIEEGGDESCPTEAEITAASTAQPAIASALVSPQTEAAAPVAASAGRVTITEAVTRFKTKMDVSNASPGENVHQKGQFFWMAQVAAAITAELQRMQGDPTATAFATKALVAATTIRQGKDASKLLVELSTMAAKSTSPEKPKMLAMLRPPQRTPNVTEALLWAALNKTDQVPSLAGLLSLPTLKMLRRWDEQSCGFHAHKIAERLHQKGGISTLNPKARAFSAHLATGGAVRDRRPMGTPTSAFGPGATAGVQTGSNLQLGDVVRQAGVGGAVSKLIQALDDGQVIHARVLSGIGYGLGGPPPNPVAKPTPIPTDPPEEHSLLIIGSNGGDTFVFSDPDASVSHTPEAGFGELFHDPVDGRLSTAPAPGGMPVDEGGKHRRGDKRYQIISLDTI